MLGASWHSTYFIETIIVFRLAASCFTETLYQNLPDEKEPRSIGSVDDGI